MPATAITGYDEVEIFISLNIGKSDHHAVALSRTREKLYDKPLPNTEHGLAEVLRKLEQHGPALVVVDQPATIGALPVAVAQSMGVMVGYLPELTMLCGFDDDLAAQITQVSNRVRGLYTQIHPVLGCCRAQLR